MLLIIYNMKKIIDNLLIRFFIKWLPILKEISNFFSKFFIIIEIEKFCIIINILKTNKSQYIIHFKVNLELKLKTNQLLI